jgi:endonuclease-3
MNVMQILDLVKEKDVSEGIVPGMERAIPKNKGVEFGALLHQFAVEFAATPHKPELRKILLEIDPEASPRLPKRRSKQALAAEKTEPEEEVKPEKKSAASKAAAKKAAPAEAKNTDKSKSKQAVSKTNPDKKATPTKKPTKSKTASKPSSQKRSTSKGLSKKKPR